MDHFEMDQVMIFKTKFIDFLRLIDTSPLQRKLRQARKIEEVGRYLDKLFEAFCQKYVLPPVPKVKES